MSLPQNILALLGGEPARTLPEPKWPIVGPQELEWMRQVVESGKWSWLGPHEQAFCEEYRAFIGTRYCLAMSNGTVTLQCALQAVGVVPGDEVIVPGVTWVATAQAALDIGANVVFADVDPMTLCLDPESFEAAITPKTKAVIPVHLYGCMCDMDALMRIAREHGVKVVEDVAHQQGSRWRDKAAGAIGDAGSFSFQQSKVLTSGEGGAVTTDDEAVYATCFALKQVGWAPESPQEVPYERLAPANRYGHNYRITEMQAVLLRGGLSRLEEQTAKREENVAYLREAFDGIGGPLQIVPRDTRVTRQAYYCLTAHYEPAQADSVHRDQFFKALSKEGVDFNGSYGVVYRNRLLNLYDDTSPVPFRNPEVMQDYASLSLANAEKACAETAAVLPHQHLLGDKDYIDQIVSAVRKVTENLPAVREYFETNKE